MEHPLSSGGAVHLLVSNQSFEVDPVDIEIRIDGKIVASGEFSVGGDQPPQHNWQQYELSLVDGSHTLVVSSDKGDARSEIMFETPAVRAVTVAFWHGRRPGSGQAGGFFTIELGGGPTATM